MHRTPFRIHEHEVIHNGSMQIDIIGTGRIRDPSCVGLLDRLSASVNRTDAPDIVFVPPNWERRAPVSFATDGPILDVLQPRAEPPLTDPIGSPPTCACVEFQHPVLDSGHSNEPGIHGIVEQWVTCTPAMGVIVGVGFLV